VCTAREKMPKSVRTSIFKGTHESHERYLVAKYLKPGDRVLEIGAATGLVSLICAKHCGAENVLSYEANEEMEALIRENFSLNSWQPNLVMKAVTVDGADVSFFISDNVYSSSLIDRSDTIDGKQVTVVSDAFEKIIEEFKPTALVMDVEGAEIDLLGNVDLGGVKKVIVELHPHITGQDVTDGLENRLAGLGFKNIETAHKTVFYQKN